MDGRGLHCGLSIVPMPKWRPLRLPLLPSVLAGPFNQTVQPIKKGGSANASTLFKPIAEGD